MTHTPSIKRTKPTSDEDAQRVNLLLDDVTRMSSIGLTLYQILMEKFEGDLPGFKRWCQATVDRDWLSCTRYMVLNHHLKELRGRGIIRLSDAYRYLGIDTGAVDLAEVLL